MALSSRQRLPYDTNLLAPAPGRPRLPITDQVVQDILFAQPRGQLPAAELAELFGAKSGAEREHLLKVVARVGELCWRQRGGRCAGGADPEGGAGSRAGGAAYR